MKRMMQLLGLALLVVFGLAACGQAVPTGSTGSNQAAGAAQRPETGTQPSAVMVSEPTQPPAAVAEPTTGSVPSPDANATSGIPIATSHGGPVIDHVSFVDHLRGNGLTVDIVDSVEQPFLKAKGTQLRISGGSLTQPADLQSYNYDDTDLGTNGLAAADADAEQFSPDGNPKTAQVNWVAAPHWFHKERVIVLYLGDDPAVLALLSDSLGPQFAGK